MPSIFYIYKCEPSYLIGNQHSINYFQKKNLYITLPTFNQFSDELTTN